MVNSLGSEGGKRRRGEEAKKGKWENVKMRKLEGGKRGIIKSAI